jgi:trigger factor
MKVTTEKIEGSQVVLTIEADEAEMEKSLEGAYRRLAARTTVPGFRKGKAPRSMLERYLGREALVEEAANQLLAESYDRAINEHKIDPIAQPKVEILRVEPLSFKATVPVRPTVELGNYHEIRFEPETVQVAEEEINQVLERLRFSQSTWEPVEREAKFEDLLNIDVEGVAKGNTIVQEKGGWYQLSPDMPPAFPGFGENLLGAKKGEQRTFTIKLPAEHHKDLAGEECSFKVTVNEIKQRNLPNLDDDFAKSLGYGVETLEALREKIGAEIKAEKERIVRSKLEDKAVEALVAISRLEYPEVMVQHEIDHLIEERKRYRDKRESLEDYLKNLKKTDEEFRNELRPVAEDIIKRSLVIEKLREVENINVSDAEVDSEIEQIIQRAKDERVREVFSTLSSRETLKRNMSLRKTLDRLVELVTAKREESAVSGEKEGGKENGETTK